MKPLIVANWKMNPQTLQEAKELFDGVSEGIKDTKNIEVVICPPFPFIFNLKSNNLNLKLGSQDCFWAESGAYTGEVSSKMLKDLGCQYVILGHSERRRVLGETGEDISKKVQAVLKEKMIPILCIDKVSQLDNVWQKGTIVAFEPLFAIGTGSSCDKADAKKMLMEIKNKIGKKEQILYGGSIDSKNALGYIKEAGFDGLLIGGASLVCEEFIKIVKNI
ncbi:MAG: triose-phosphate isomerase [Parcubacteria group bacterium]